MAIPVWPTELPQAFLRDGFKITQSDGRIFAKTDKGPPKVRRGATSVPRRVDAQILVDQTQRARFDMFWDTDTGGVVKIVIPSASILTPATGSPAATAPRTARVTSDWRKEERRVISAAPS